MFVWQEDQLGLSLLTLEQLQSEDMLQKIAQIAQQAWDLRGNKVWEVYIYMYFFLWFFNMVFSTTRSINKCCYLASVVLYCLKRNILSKPAAEGTQAH